MSLTPSSRLVFALLVGPLLLLAYLLERVVGTPGLTVAALAIPPAVLRLRDARLRCGSLPCSSCPS